MGTLVDIVGPKFGLFSLQDLCYFNFLCAMKLGLVSDFNHIYSNLGYVMLGTLFVIIAYGRDLSHRKWIAADPGREKLGVPQHFGMHYAMGTGLIIEGNQHSLILRNRD